MESGSDIMKLNPYGRKQKHWVRMLASNSALKFCRSMHSPIFLLCTCNYFGVPGALSVVFPCVLFEASGLHQWSITGKSTPLFLFMNLTKPLCEPLFSF